MIRFVFFFLLVLGRYGCRDILLFDGEEFYDQTEQLFNKTFQVEYYGEGQGMTQGWKLIGPGFDRVTAGTKVAWLSSGGEIFGKPCGWEICFQLGLDSRYPRYFLETYPNSRVVWRPSFYGLKQSHMFKVYCNGSLLSAAKCQIISRQFHDNNIFLRVFDIFLIWCRSGDCWYTDVNSYWKFLVQF